MNYENYPIKYADNNIIPPNPASDALLAEYNRQFVKATFCDMSEPAVEEIENRIVINTIDAFYNNDDDDALCQYDCLMMSIADDLDPDKTISRDRLNMLLLDRCDGLRVVILDVEGVSHYIISKDVRISGIVGARLVGCGIDPELAELYGDKISKELSYEPDKIKAVVIEQCESIAEIESSFNFDDDDYYFAPDTDDDVPRAEILQHLKEKRAEKELLNKESVPVSIEVHKGGTVKKYDTEVFRDLVKDLMKSKQEQDSFIKIAVEILSGEPNMFHPDQ